MRIKNFLILIIMLVFLCAIEFTLFNTVSKFLTPDLLLIFVVFTAIFMGTRSGFSIAIIAGLLKDSTSANIVSINLISFLICIFILIRLKKYIYHSYSVFSLFTLTLLILAINLFCKYMLYQISYNINFVEALKYAVLPEFLSTVIFYPILIIFFRKCVLKP